MGKPIVNYLDIQLRDMDWDNEYGGDIYRRFIDPNGIYNPPDGYVEGFSKAWSTADDVLDLNVSATKRGHGTIVDVLKKVCRDRRKKERKFIDAWKKYNDIKDGKVKIKFPYTEDYTRNGNQEYAESFSEFIKTSLGDNEIVNLLRSPEFRAEVSGLASSVYSTRAANRNTTRQMKGRSAINEYYNDLFNTFFGLKRARKGKKTIYAEDFDKYNADALFKQRFAEFITKYYGEIGSNPKFWQALDQGISETISKSIYRRFESDAPDSFTLNFEEKTGRGVSEKVEHQLKKMLLQTLRLMGNATGNVSEFSIPGIIEVNPLWTQDSSGYHMEVQVWINKERERRSALKEAKRNGELVDGKKVNMRTENRCYELANDNDIVGASGDPVQTKKIFLNFFFTHIESNLGRKLTAKEKDELSQAAFQKLDKTIKRGDKALDIMSIFGPAQMRGFLGEWATAYALRIMKGRTYTEITGKSINGVGQANYDVVAAINDFNIGFQVKNYAPGSKTLYETEIGLGRQEAKKYLGKDLPVYKWIFANGIFLSEWSHQDIRGKMEDSFYNYVPEFLRISDASVDNPEDLVNSDIYVIGNNYYPASYLVALIIEKVEKDLKEKKQELFSLTGDFPAYQHKAAPQFNFHFDSEKNYGYKKEEHGNKENFKKNLIYIKDMQSARKFGNAKIHFKGITVDIKI